MHNITAILHNFYLICQWHRSPFDEEAFNIEYLHKLNVMENEEEEIGKETDKVRFLCAIHIQDIDEFVKEDKEGVSGLTLLTVRRQLRLGRKAIWQHSQRLINDFIDCSKLDNSNTHMVKQIVVNDLCDYFMQVPASIPY